jgi:hypothetical protein
MLFGTALSLLVLPGVLWIALKHSARVAHVEAKAASASEGAATT